MYNEEKVIGAVPGYTFLGVLHLSDEQMAALMSAGTTPKGKRGKRRALAKARRAARDA